MVPKTTVTKIGVCLLALVLVAIAHAPIHTDHVGNGHRVAYDAVLVVEPSGIHLDWE